MVLERLRSTWSPPKTGLSYCLPALGRQERIHLIAKQSRYLQVSVSTSTSHSPANKRGPITQRERLVGTTTDCPQPPLQFRRQISGKPRGATQPSPPAAAQGTAPEASSRHLVRTGGRVTLCTRGGEIALCQPAASSARELSDLSHPSECWGRQTAAVTQRRASGCSLQVLRQHINNPE